MLFKPLNGKELSSAGRAGLLHWLLSKVSIYKAAVAWDRAAPPHPTHACRHAPNQGMKPLSSFSLKPLSSPVSDMHESEMRLAWPHQQRDMLEHLLPGRHGLGTVNKKKLEVESI